CDQHELDLLARYARKPFQKLVNPRAAFEVFEQRLHGHAGTLEQPGTADLSWRAFHRWTLAPIKHGQILRNGWLTGKKSVHGHAILKWRPNHSRTSAKNAPAAALSSHG